jgi:Trp operon repressor
MGEIYHRPSCVEHGTSPEPDPQPVSVHHVSSQTALSCEDLLARAQEIKELEMLKVELHVAQSNLNKEKSQRQVSEELVKIVQTDVSSLTERNMSEVMARVKVENELTDVKVNNVQCGLYYLK